MILADLGVAERRLERLDKDLKKGASPELRKEQEIVTLCRETLEAGRPLRGLELAPADLEAPARLSVPFREAAPAGIERR